MKNLTLALSFGLLLGACNQDNPEPNEPTPTNTNSPFLKASIDSYVWDVTEPLNGCLETMSTSGNSENTDPDYMVYDYHTSINQDTDGSALTEIATPLIGELSVSFSGIRYTTDEYYNNRKETYLTYFYLGNYNFYSVSSASNPGVEIFYIDENQEKWSSKFGTQTTSTFNVTNCETKNWGTAYGKNMKGTFSCKIYSETNPTLFKTVSNGKFNLNFNG
jgi:hypothetical protein